MELVRNQRYEERRETFCPQPLCGGGSNGGGAAGGGGGLASGQSLLYVGGPGRG